jgi:hypothetical protein
MLQFHPELDKISMIRRCYTTDGNNNKTILNITGDRVSQGIHRNIFMHFPGYTYAVTKQGASIRQFFAMIPAQEMKFDVFLLTIRFILLTNIRKNEI